MRLLWLTVLGGFLLAGCAPHAAEVTARQNPIDCAFNGPCTGAPGH
jgi:hypothetical protein